MYRCCLGNEDQYAAYILTNYHVATHSRLFPSSERIEGILFLAKLVSFGLCVSQTTVIYGSNDDVWADPKRDLAIVRVCGC